MNGTIRALNHSSIFLSKNNLDVTRPDVSRSVALISGVFRQFLPRALGDGNYCVPAVHNPLFQYGKKPAFPRQLKWHFTP